MKEYLLELLEGMGPELAVVIGSMIPILELRVALPVAIANGMPTVLAYFLAVLGNCIPVPFIIWFIRPIFDFLKHKTFLKSFVLKMEERAQGKADKIRSYQKWGLFLFVAIPLPGTGAWTGSLVAAFLGMRLKDAAPAIIAGVMAAGLIMTCGTHLVQQILSWF